MTQAKKANDFLDSLRAEGEVVLPDAPLPSAAGSAASAAAAAPMADPVALVVDEKLQVVLNKDGGLETMEVQGTMSLQV